MDGEIFEIVTRSFFVSFTATLTASLVAVPLAVWLCFKKGPLKNAIVIISHSMLSVPAVVIGLCCYLFFTNSGPLGPLKLLYTPVLMILAQAILVLPITISITYTGLQPFALSLRDLLHTLGTDPFQTVASIVYEGRRQIMTAMIMAFSRVIGETGMTMMVGGNIKGHTRVMTTTIALETMKGNFELAVRLGIILFTVAVALNVVLHVVIGRGRVTPV